MSEPPSTPAPTPQYLLLPAVAFEGGMAVLAVGLGWLLDRPPLASYQWSAEALARGAAAGLVPLAVVVPILLWPVGPLRTLLRIVDEVLLPLFRPCNLLDLAIIAFLAGLGEEMLFRAIIQGSLSDWIGGSWGVGIGLGISALLFGIAHWLTPVYALLAGLIGLYFGWLWIATGNLLTPIAAHAIYDFVALVYLAKIRRPPCAVPSPPS